MPKNPRGYPDEIELKVEDRVGTYSDEDSFNTEDQQQVARDLLEEWPARFQEIAEGKSYSRQMIPNVLEDYFGPVGSDITFAEIEEEYGGYKQYESKAERTLRDLDIPNAGDVSERELNMIVAAMQDGWEDGYSKGHDQGFDKGYEAALREHGISQEQE